MTSQLWSIARTDWRNRTRQRSFLPVLGLVLLATIYFLPPADASYSTLSVNGLRGLYTSAYVGAVAGTLVAFLLGIIGFFTGAATNFDFRTRMAEVVATYPVSRPLYIAGKWLGHLMFLTALTLASFLASGAVQWLRHEAPLHWDVLAEYYLAFPIVLVVSVAGLMALADVVGLASRVGGHILFFFTYLTLIGLGAGLAPAGESWVDPTGIAQVAFRVADSLIASGRLSLDSLNIIVGNPGQPATGVFAWSEPLGGWAEPRVVWIGVGLLAALVAMLAYRGYRIKPLSRRVDPGAVPRSPRWVRFPSYVLTTRHPLIGWVWADMIALFAEFPYFWGVVLLPVLAVSVPADSATSTVLPLAFLLAVVGVARTTTRCRDDNVDTIVKCAPGIQRSMWFWQLASSAAIALLAIAPAALIVSLRGFDTVLVVALVGALQLSALVTALASLSASSNTTLGIAVGIWYLNVLDRPPAMIDWMGLHSGGSGVTAGAAAFTVMLLVIPLLSKAVTEAYRWRPAEAYGPQNRPNR